MVDTVLGLLPPQMLRDADVTAIVEDAVTVVGGHYETDPWAVIAKLEETGAPVIANRLRVAAANKAGRRCSRTTRSRTSRRTTSTRPSPSSR
jgi:hypothetical protein